MTQMTRRAVISSTVTGALGVALRVDAASPAADPVLEVINTELAAMVARGGFDPRNVERLRALGSTFRVIDAVASAHDLKRHLKKAHVGIGDAARADHLARHLRARGLTVNGDDLLRRHLDARAQFDVDVTPAMIAAIRSGAILREVSTAFDTLATATAESGVVGGATFRESLHGPAFLWAPRQTAPRFCGWGRQYAGRWGFLAGIVAFGFGLIPELAAIGIAYGAASLFFDGFALGCEFW